MSVDGYPEKDWPFTFYFNGVELPKWAAQWHWCGFNWLNNPDESFERFIGWHHIWHLECRMDHTAPEGFESEDPQILRFACQEVLWRCLFQRREVLECLKDSLLEEEATAEEVFHGIVHGAAQMIALSHRDRLAFWNNGYPEDQARLKEDMIPFRMQATQPPPLEPPHVKQRRFQLCCTIKSRLSDLRRLAQSGTLEKPLRALLNQLPDAD